MLKPENASVVGSVRMRDQLTPDDYTVLRVDGWAGVQPVKSGSWLYVAGGDDISKPNLNDYASACVIARKVDVKVNDKVIESSHYDFDANGLTCEGPTVIRRGDSVDAHVIVTEGGKQSVLPVVVGGIVDRIEADVSDGAIVESRIHFVEECA